MSEEHFISVELHNSTKLRKNFSDLSEEKQKEIRLELAQDLLKTVRKTFEEISFDDFVEYFCVFKRYCLKPREGIKVLDAVEY